MTQSDDATAVFDLLSDETRAETVRQLAAASGGLRFSTLRRRVGARDSGRFNYHLGRLRGRLVEKRDARYVLTERGRHVAATLDGIGSETQRS